MKEINLEEIFNNLTDHEYALQMQAKRGMYLLVIPAMKEAIQQALELAAESCGDIHVPGKDKVIVNNVTNKQSILNVINLVK